MTACALETRTGQQSLTAEASEQNVRRSIEPLRSTLDRARRAGVRVDDKQLTLEWALIRGTILVRNELEQLIASRSVSSRGPHLSTRTGPHVSPKTPRSRAVDETVALAIKLGRITNSSLIAAGLVATPSGADQRIQATLKLARIERVERGLYEAVPAEYFALGLDASLKGRSSGKRVLDLVHMMQSLRAPPEVTPLPDEEPIDFDDTPRDISGVPHDINDLNEDEVQVVMALRALPQGESRTLGDLAWDVFHGDCGADPTLRVRNALRRPQSFDLVRRVHRGRYLAVRMPS